MRVSVLVGLGMLAVAIYLKVDKVGGWGVLSLGPEAARVGRGVVSRAARMGGGFVSSYCKHCLATNPTTRTALFSEGACFRTPLLRSPTTTT